MEYSWQYLWQVILITCTHPNAFTFAWNIPLHFNKNWIWIIQVKTWTSLVTLKLIEIILASEVLCTSLSECRHVHGNCPQTDMWTWNLPAACKVVRWPTEICHRLADKWCPRHRICHPTLKQVNKLWCWKQHFWITLIPFILSYITRGPIGPIKLT